MKLKQNRKVLFDALTHSYWAGDKELVGVTTLMRHQGLSPDYSGIDPQVLSHAASRGTAIHKALELYDNGQDVLQPVVVNGGDGEETSFDTSAELKAYKELGLRVLASEYLVSDNKTVASSIDKVLATDEDGVFDLADIKTTSVLHAESLAWQLSIYAYLFEMQNKGAKVRSLLGVHVRNGKAVLRAVNRKGDEKVKALIEAERKGERLAVSEDIPQLSLVIPEEAIRELSATEAALAQAKETVAALSDKVKEAQDAICSYMLSHNLSEMACAFGSYKLRRPSVRESFDSKRFKDADPETYARYVKRSEVKGSVSFTPAADINL